MAVREGLLALLADGPSHGYQLKVGFETATGGVWPLNVGQVYTTLDRLERDGLVAADEHDGQKTYAITAAGTLALGEWWEATPGDEPPPRDELLLKVLFAIEQDPARADAVIARQRHAVLSLLQNRRRAARARATTSEEARPPDGPELAGTLMDDALVVRAEADLRWLDLCEERLAQRKKLQGKKKT